MQKPRSALAERFLSEAPSGNFSCGSKIVTFISLLTVLTIGLNHVTRLMTQGDATTLASLHMQPLKSKHFPQQTWGLHFMQPTKISQPLKRSIVRQFVRPVTAFASVDTQNLAQQAELQAAIPQPLGRRHTGLAGVIGGLAMVIAQPSFSEEGPDGLTYQDLQVGDGKEVSKGDKLTVAYSLRTVNDGLVVETNKAFKFSTGENTLIRGWYLAVLGGGDMAPMKEGGVREVMIPPALGYGNKAGGCRMSGGTEYCTIPPKNRLKLKITLKSID